MNHVSSVVCKDAGIKIFFPAFLFLVNVFDKHILQCLVETFNQTICLQKVIISVKYNYRLLVTCIMLHTWGWYAVVIRCLIWSVAMSSLFNALLNSVPWSVVITRGIPIRMKSYSACTNTTYATAEYMCMCSYSPWITHRPLAMHFYLGLR